MSPVQVEIELSPAAVPNLRKVVKICCRMMMRAMGMTMITSAQWRHTSIALPRSFQERKLRI